MMELVRAVEVPAQGDAIVEALAIKDVLDAKICGAVSDFDAEVSWAFEHATSMTAWLR